MTSSANPISTSTKRTFLTRSMVSSVALAASLTANLSSAQSTPQARRRLRIPTTATGQAAIGRVRGRLQISFDDVGLRFGAPIYLRLIKDQKRLEVWVQSRQQVFIRLRSYKVCGTSLSSGPRTTARPLKQPEGFYSFGTNNLRPSAAPYLGLDMNWPNAYDQAQGWRGTASLMQAGCAGEPHFGLTDQDMEEVYALVHAALANGQQSVSFHIFPFAMSGLRMMTASNSPYTAFWRGLAPAWQAFERTKKPPQVRVSGRRYIVSEG